MLRPPPGWAPWLAMAALAGAVAAVVGFAGPEGAQRRAAAPAITLPLPPAPAADPPAGATFPPEAAALPAPAPALVVPKACAEPCVGVIITGLGLARAPTSRALELPAAVGLSFSPYAADLADRAGEAAAAGHPVLIDLPLQPARYPVDDSGPLTLALAAEPTAQRAVLARVLGSADVPWRAVAAAAGAFGRDPPRFAPLARELAARRLPVVELGGDALREVAARGGLGHLPAAVPGADAGGAAAVDLALGRAEEAALRGGTALAALPPSPVALERLAAWLPTLADKGLSLADAGRLLEAAAAVGQGGEAAAR